MSNREERNSQGDEYPIDDPVPQEENHINDEGNQNDDASEDDHTVTSSEAADREAAKEAPGVDMRVAPREHSGLYVMVFFIIFSFISFALMLTSSTTIAWYKAKDRTIWTLWKDADGKMWKDNACQHKAQIFQAMQAFTIAGCVLSFGTVLAGVLQAVGVGHMGVSLLFAAVTMISNLVAWSLGVHQYHKYNCPGEIAYVDKINRLNAGFSLTIISFAFMLFAFVTLLYYFYTYYSWSDASKKSMSIPALTCALLTGGCLCITCVGSAFTLWEDYSVTHKIKVTLWHVEMLQQNTGLSEFYSYKGYQCKALNTMFSAGQAFAIISAAFLFLATLLTMAAVYSRVCKWVAFALGLASWVFLAVDWAILIAMRYKTFCKNGTVAPLVHGLRPVPLNKGEQEVTFTGFVITEGLGMIISAWCAMTLIVIYLAVKG